MRGEEEWEEVGWVHVSVEDEVGSRTGIWEEIFVVVDRYAIACLSSLVCSSLT